jgi:hypothetical protein
MKRIFTLLLTATLVIGPTLNAQASGAIEGGPCTSWHTYVRPAMPMTKIVNRTKHTIRCAVDWVHGVPGGLSMAYCIADRESHFYPWAENPSGSTGVYQWISSTWYGVRERYPWLARHTMDTRFSMRSNVLFFARVAHNEGLGPWGGGC